MKTKLLLFLFSIFSCMVYAQPQGINYQGVARDASGNALLNQSISLRLSILDSSAIGQAVYVETHNATTNTAGMFNLSIGTGTVVSGVFANIPWGNGDKWLKIEMDAAGGTNYQLIGTSQFLSVPYALYAKNGMPPGTNTGEILYWNGTAWTSIQGGVNGQSLVYCDGVPTWGDCLPSYPSVTICGQTWMLKNLDVDRYRNGDPIPKVTNPSAWSNLTSGAYCYYNNDSATYASVYGKLYNWYAVSDPMGLAPVGYHVPSESEWISLETCLGGSSVAGGKMKETGFTHWTSPNTDATNSSGFTGLPGGNLFNFGSFGYNGTNGNWWSSTEYIIGFAWYRYLSNHSGNLTTDGGNEKDGFSVRCLKD